MKRNILALLLVLTMLLSLCACGGGNSQGNDAQNGGSQQGGDAADGGDAAQTPDAGTPSGGDSQDAGPAPAPEGGDDATPDAPGGAEADSGAGDATPEVPAVGINYTDITLRSKGETLRLTPTGVTGTYAAAYTSGDESIAAVDGNGTVTAAAPGTTTVALHVECESGQYDFTCIVRCRWEERTEPDTPTVPDNGPEDPPPAAELPSVSEFFATLAGSYDTLNSLGAVEGEVLESLYPGLASADGAEQVLVMEPVISFSTVAVGLVKLSDGATAAQIQAVKDIFQARLDSQASGGAYYPAAADAWAAGQVVSAGNYVGMFVHADSAKAMADLFLSTYGG